LFGRTDIEDALARLDRLTQEEVRMAVAEGLKVTHGVDDKVQHVDNKVQDVDDHVQRVGDEVQGVNNKVQQIADDMGDQKRSSSNILTSLVMKAQQLTGDQIRKDLRDWLSPPDPSVNYNIASDAHHEGTAMWFMESDTFNNWKASDSLLWIYGKRTSPALCSLDLALIDFHFYSWLWEECTQVRHFSPRFTRGY
jgi:hypothetical protein